MIGFAGIRSGDLVRLSERVTAMEIALRERMARMEGEMDLLLHRLAAKHGNANAQFNLGSMYADGRGVPEDETEAVRWYRLATEQGHASAQFKFGNMYVGGAGVPEDIVEAYAWLNIAAAQGVEPAEDFKARISRRMSQSQIAEAQKRSREYWTRYVVPFQ